MKKIDKNIDSYELYVDNLLTNKVNSSKDASIRLPAGKPSVPMSKSNISNSPLIESNLQKQQVSTPENNTMVTKKYHREEYTKESYKNIAMQYLNLSYKDNLNKVQSGFGPY